MRPGLSLSLLLAILLSACATSSPAPTMFYGLSDREFDLLGRRLGYRVEVLSASDYRFSRHGHSFRAIGPRGTSAYNGVHVDHSVELRGAIRGRRGTLVSRLSVTHGVPFATVEEQFRRFISATKPHEPQT